MSIGGRQPNGGFYMQFMFDGLLEKCAVYLLIRIA